MKLKVIANVRYWEDTEINWKEDTEDWDNIPCKIDEKWCPIIDTETWIIENWEKWKIARVHYKVCDECSWELYDNEKLISSEYNKYVPDTLCPWDEGYWDYIIMNIDENWKIENWDFNEEDFNF